MDVQEKDLYSFIFFPIILSSNKIEYINGNRERFKNEFELLSALKDYIESQVSKEIIARVKLKIREFIKENSTLISNI